MRYSKGLTKICLVDRYLNIVLEHIMIKNTMNNIIACNNYKYCVVCQIE